VTPPLFSDDATAMLAQINDDNLPHLATVSVPATAGARVGGALVDVTAAVLLAGTPCRLTPLSAPSPIVDAAQPRSAQAFVLAFARGTVVPANAIAVVTGTYGPALAAWTKRVRVVESWNERLATSMARYLCVDAGPAGAGGAL
jgi:hypothetical protein